MALALLFALGGAATAAPAARRPAGPAPTPVACATNSVAAPVEFGVVEGSVAAHELTLAWRQPAPAGGGEYRLSLMRADASGGAVTKTMTLYPKCASACTARVVGLASSADYVLWIQPLGAAGCLGPSSPIVTASCGADAAEDAPPAEPNATAKRPPKALAAPSPPPAPSPPCLGVKPPTPQLEVNNASLGTNSLMLTWSMPPADGAPVSAYSLVVADASGGRLARSVTPPVASCEFGCRLGIADLAPGTLYSVELAAVTGAGCRGGAAALSVVTLPAPPCNSTDDTGAPAPLAVDGPTPSPTARRSSPR